MAWQFGIFEAIRRENMEEILKKSLIEPTIPTIQLRGVRQWLFMMTS
ncbi:hypothetical protein [Anabaena sp. UHCC 0399]|nr:hypothetical protein [Anabaena sp. UHCC 0399]MEA5564341.1 hypothetical protein [Anabaena sp. UHCC 0399]